MLLLGWILMSASLPGAHAAETAYPWVDYYTIDTNVPVDVYELMQACNDDLAQARKKVSEVSQVLTGSADSFQVFGYFGQDPHGQTTTESYCYLKFISTTKKFGLVEDVAVQMTHLSSSTWGTACQPAYQALLADPGTLITDYEESATLFQGKICDVPYVKAVPQ